MFLNPLCGEKLHFIFADPFLRLLAADGSGQHVGHGGEKGLFRRFASMPFVDIKAQRADRMVARSDRNAIMAVRRHPRITGLVASVDAVGEDDFPRTGGMAAMAAAQRHFAARREQFRGQPAMGFHDQCFRVLLGEKDGPLRLQAEPGQREEQVERVLQLLFERRPFQRDVQDIAQDDLGAKLRLDLLFHVEPMHRFADQGRHRLDELDGRQRRHSLPQVGDMNRPHDFLAISNGNDRQRGEPGLDACPPESATFLGRLAPSN